MVDIFVELGTWFISQDKTLMIGDPQILIILGRMEFKEHKIIV